MAFPFACPNCKNSWPLGRQEFEKVSKHLPLECRECGKKFDIIDGLTETITTDNIFIQYTLRSNYALFGLSEVIPGEVKAVNLKDRFSEIHKIFLTATGPSPVYCKPAKISNSRFLIISSKYKGHLYPEKIQVSWVVYGNKRGVETPLWRQLLSNAKGYEIESNYRMEIVELETAFEVFLAEYLKPRLEKICTDQIVEMIFEHFRRMEDVTTLVFKVATGKKLKEMLEDVGRAELHGNWKKYVKDQRDRILHRGQEISKIQAKKAFETVFKIIVILEPKSLEYLYTSFEEHGSI